MSSRPAPTIEKLASECAQLLTAAKARDTVSPEIRLAIADLHYRYMVWTGNVGAFAKTTGSIDYRLRDDQDIASAVVFALARLLTCLDNIVNPALPEEEEEEEEEEEDEDWDEFEVEAEGEGEEDEGEFLPMEKMKRWLEKKPRGFGVGKKYETLIEDKLLEEIEQSWKAQAANLNKLKNNDPLKPQHNLIKGFVFLFLSLFPLSLSHQKTQLAAFE